jgi:hypothetical protein
MKNFYLRWIWLKLIDDLRQWHVAVCDGLFSTLEAQEKKIFGDRVIDNES